MVNKEEIKELFNEATPRELLTVSCIVLNLLSKEAFLFGRGNEIDINKAKDLINNLVLDTI